MSSNSSAQKTPFLACEGVSVQFFDRETPVLKEMNVAIAEKESVLLLGPSGCGKSTLLQVLSGIIPRSIEAWIKGNVIRPKQVGVMFQDPDAQFCMLTVEDEIAFSMENRQVPPAEMHSRIERLMEQVRLHVPLDTKIQELSGGLKQRLALACMLALEPDVLFFDEPTAQLDPESTRQVLADIARLKGKKTIVLIEHKLDGVIDWVDRVILFDAHGQIQGDGDPATVLREQAQAMQKYGIWQPRLWPVTWQQLLTDAEHPIALRLEQQLQAKAEEALLKEETESNVDPVPNKVTPLVEVQNGTMRYKNGHTVWSDLDVTVQAGEWVAVLGANGAGKSTFLKTLGGLLPLTSGQVLFKKQEIGKYKTEALYDAVGYVFQNPEHQFIADTVYEEVAFGGRLAGWSAEKIDRETKQLLADFHLSELQDKNPFTLSQGQKRRLSVAGMLLKNQELLLLDEPTFGQDAATTRELLERIAERRQKGTAVIMATHDVELVAEWATRVLVFADHRLSYDGTPEELFVQPELLQQASLTEPLCYEYKRRRASLSRQEGMQYV